jgi:hypothetical protein
LCTQIVPFASLCQAAQGRASQTTFTRKAPANGDAASRREKANICPETICEPPKMKLSHSKFYKNRGKTSHFAHLFPSRWLRGLLH